MPWIIPSHQAPVLPLKAWRPAWFSGLGLALGSVAPDLCFILSLDPLGSPASHTFAGQLYLTIPLVLALHRALTQLVLPWLLPHLPGGAPLHLHALARSRPARGAAQTARVAFSGLVGGLTHVTIDGFTHGDHSGWALAFLPVLATPVPLPLGSTPLHDVLQVVLTLVLGWLGLRQWGRMARALPAPGPGAAAVWEVRPAPARACRRGWRALLLAALAGVLAGPLLRSAFGTPDALKLAAYGAVTFAAAGVFLGALADRAARALARVRLDLARGLEG
jgi:hypothetical protein